MFIELQDGIPADHAWMFMRDRLAINSCAKIGSAQGDQRSISEPYDRGREMHFNDRTRGVIAGKDIGYPRGITVHGATRIDSLVLLTVAALVLDRVKYSCPDNS